MHLKVNKFEMIAIYEYKAGYKQSQYYHGCIRIKKLGVKVEAGAVYERNLHHTTVIFTIKPRTIMGNSCW
jgi:hypothetical protein